MSGSKVDPERFEELARIALVSKMLGATIIEADIGAWAVDYAMSGWAVFPLRGKMPAIPNPHPKDTPERISCKGECGMEGHGCLDATTDLMKVMSWWSGDYLGCNIGLVPPENVIVIDIDPRHNGHISWQLLLKTHAFGREPETMQTISGRGDGGRHLYFQRPGSDRPGAPPGELTGQRLRGTGIDLKSSTGYVVAAPSIHPETGKAYSRIDAPVAACPPWLSRVLLKEPQQATQRREWTPSADGTEGPADWYSKTASWRDILDPLGWTCVIGDGDQDGSCWRHPEATSPISATIRHGCLFCYSPNTRFEITESGNPKGYTRFAAYALLYHNNDMSAAALAIANGEWKQ